MMKDEELEQLRNAWPDTTRESHQCNRGCNNRRTFSDLPVEWFQRSGPPLDNCPTIIYTEHEEYAAGQLLTKESRMP